MNFLKFPEFRNANSTIMTENTANETPVDEPKQLIMKRRFRKRKAQPPKILMKETNNPYTSQSARIFSARKPQRGIQDFVLPPQNVDRRPDFLTPRVQHRNVQHQNFFNTRNTPRDTLGFFEKQTRHSTRTFLQQGTCILEL